MSHLSEILGTLVEASYKGAPFLMNSSNIEGGRKLADHQIADSDRQFLEDMGLRQRGYSISCIIAPRFDEEGKILISYNNQRDGLLAALEDDSGPGELVHPWYGPIQDIVCRNWNLTENLNELGIGRITITFGISNTNITPIVEEDEFFGMQLNVDLTLQSIEDAFVDGYNVETTFAGELKGAMDKASSFVEDVRKATEPIAILADKINSFTLLVSEFEADVASLVKDPLALADGIRNIVSSIGGLYATAEGTLIAFKNLFDFGDLDIDSQHLTPSAFRQNQNTHIFNSAVQTHALSNAYLSAAKINFLTVDEIIREVSELEIQFQKIITNVDTPIEIIEPLTDLRTSSQGFFETKKLNASKVIEVDVNPMSVRSIAYLYYGSSDAGEDVARLNGLYDYAYHTGKINILTA